MTAMHTDEELRDIHNYCRCAMRMWRSLEKRPAFAFAMHNDWRNSRMYEVNAMANAAIYGV